MPGLALTPTRRQFACGLAALAAIRPGPAAANGWPERGVRLVTPAAPGSSTDMAARLYAERLAAVWGQPVVVEPRTGADGIIAAEAMLGARDGHTLLFSPTGVVTVTPLLRERMPFDPIRDITPISLMATDFLCVAVTATLPEVGSLQNLVDAARGRPGTLSVAAGLGGLSLALPAFLRDRGLVMTAASYRSPPDAIPDLITGRLHVLLGPLAPMLRLVRDGRVRVLAVTNPERTPAAPQVPTVIEEGYPELEVEGTIGLFGPTGLPNEARNRISHAVTQVAADPSLAERLGIAGIVPRAELAEVFAQRLARQRAQYAAMAARAGAKAP